MGYAAATKLCSVDRGGNPRVDFRSRRSSKDQCLPWTDYRLFESGHFYTRRAAVQIPARGGVLRSTFGKSSRPRRGHFRWGFLEARTGSGQLSLIGTDDPLGLPERMALAPTSEGGAFRKGRPCRRPGPAADGPADGRGFFTANCIPRPAGSPSDAFVVSAWVAPSPGR